MNNLDDRIARTRDKIGEIRKRWPFHSPKVSMVRELEDLEIELEELLTEKRCALKKPGLDETGPPGGDS